MKQLQDSGSETAHLSVSFASDLPGGTSGVHAVGGPLWVCGGYPQLVELKIGNSKSFAESMHTGLHIS